jgi:hypothetical protein
VAHVVDDADREVVLRIRGPQLVEHRLRHGRGELLGRQPVAAADRPRHGAWAAEPRGPGHRGFGERGEDILVERLAGSARLLRPVEDRDRSHGGREGGHQRAGGERPEQPNGQHADAFARVVQRLHGFFDGPGAGSHQHDHAVRIRRPRVFHQVVPAAGALAEGVHRRLDGVGNRPVERRARLSRLEEDVWVLGGSPQRRPVRRQAAVAQGPHGVLIDQGVEVRVVEEVDPVDLVARPEAVEEVKERHAGGERRGMRYERQVLGLLDRRRREHGPSRRAHGHDVGVVAEDRQRMRGDGPCRHVDHGRRQFAGDLEHVRQHQEQALRGGECRGERAAHHGAVQHPRGARLALHLDDLGDDAPEVLSPGRAPGVGQLAHRRRGRDRVDRDDL